MKDGTEKSKAGKGASPMASMLKMAMNWRLMVVGAAICAGLLLMMAEPGGGGWAWAKGFFATKAAALALLWAAVKLGEKWDREGKLLGLDED